jgi:hypothetical protein
MAGYYDYVLGLIPLALLGISGLLHLGGGVAITAAVPAGAGAAVALIAHALFVRTPLDDESASAPSAAASDPAPPAD